jgi:iron complex transport system substrate-binding protein
MRIVSLLPSATEIICSLGLNDQLVGVTHECDYPPFVVDLPKVTQTLIPHDASSAQIDLLVRERLQTQKALYSLDMPTLEKLRPDLIVTQALCDVCAVAEEEVRAAACSLPGLPRVINLEPTTWAGVLQSIEQVPSRGRPDGRRARRARGGGGQSLCRSDSASARRAAGMDRSTILLRTLESRARCVCGR